MSSKYKILDQACFYHVTFTVLDWMDVFIRDIYREILVNSIKYCQANKGLKVGGWVIMTSHVHMIIGTDRNPIEGIIRDMKAFTSRHIRKEFELSSGESRKEWMLQKFYRAGIEKADNKDFQFYGMWFYMV